MARSALTLNEVSGGRFRLGVGSGHRQGVEGALGIEWSDAGETMREYITVVRQLFEGPVKHHGKRWNIEWGYPQPIPPAPSIHLAALNPPLMELAGEIADGVVLWMATPEYIRDVVVPKVAAGRQKAGKTLDGFDIIAPVPVAVTDDVAAANKTMRSELARYAGIPFYRREFLNAGYRDEIAAFDRDRQTKEAGEALPDRLANALGFVGKADAAKAFVQRFRDAGANLPLVRPMHPPDVARTLRSCPSPSLVRAWHAACLARPTMWETERNVASPLPSTPKQAMTGLMSRDGSPRPSTKPVDRRGRCGNRIADEHDFD